mgnify:CR=1 FL=1
MGTEKGSRGHHIDGVANRDTAPLIRLDAPSHLRAMATGAAIGGLFAAINILTSSNIPDELLALVFAVSLILVSAPFLQSVVSGLICGIIAFITQTTLEIFYYAFTGPYGVSIVAAILLYSDPSLYRLAAFPIAGVLAGYLSQKIVMKASSTSPRLASIESCKDP